MKDKLRAIWFILITPNERILLADLNVFKEGDSFRWKNWILTISKPKEKLVVI